MILETILAALVPIGIEGVKQVITKFTGGVKPTTIAEQIELQKADNETLEVVAKLDNPYGVPSQWVVDVRASARYISAGVIIVAGLVTMYVPVPTEVQAQALELVNIVFGFLFGHRVAIASFKK